MSSLALPLLVLIFVGCAAVIWVAGTGLSNTTDVLDDRLHLGSALGGVVLLAVATNLPEIAITVTAAASNNIGVAIGNILGGIAIQTVVLVALDAFGGKKRAPLLRSCHRDGAQVRSRAARTGRRAAARSAPDRAEHRPNPPAAEQRPAGLAPSSTPANDDLTQVRTMSRDITESGDAGTRTPDLLVANGDFPSVPAASCRTVVF